jgi:SAM-dependent methyltransferase
VTILFGLILFLSASLVFYFEPMVGKMLLPFLGGAPSVWTTCVLFFQAMLLAGYAYAYLLDRVARIRTQIWIHLGLMLSALLFLPIHPALHPDPSMAARRPVVWLLWRLILTTAIPFGLATSTAPLLQNWLAKTTSSAGRDPYFLYVASNAGSLLALLAYPLLIEPRWGLAAQSRMWSMGFLLLLASLILASILVSRHTKARALESPHQTDQDAPSTATHVFWLAASFVPAALMLAVTNHISANLAAAPLLWVVPLAVYLATFMLAFSKRAGVSVTSVSRWIPVILLLSPYITIGAPVKGGFIWIALTAHITLLFSGALLCHSALAGTRPPTQYLTEFYFWIALGGALAGVFAAIIAPALFRTIFEYPLLVATLAFFRVSSEADPERNRSDWVYAGVVVILLMAAWLAFRWVHDDEIRQGVAVFLINGGFVIIYGFRARTFRFSLTLATFIIGCALILPAYFEDGSRVDVARNFFGVKKVLFDRTANERRLLHGDTVHGIEDMDPAKSGRALSYYHTSGPAGDVMKLLDGRSGMDVAIVGLGAGSLAAYAAPDRRITFFDVDPQIVEIANKDFTFLHDCGTDCNVVLADGRLAITQSADASFNLLVIDAFSSDSIPPHLVSREAVQIYASKLKPGGILLFHVSNRYLDIEKLVSAQLAAAGMATFVRRDVDTSVPGKSPSVYVTAAREAESLGWIASTGKWQRVQRPPNIKLWTDDYSDVLSLIRWF